MAARLDPQHTEAGLGIVEGYPLNDAGEHFSVGLIRSRRCRHSLGYPRGRGSLANAVRMATVSASLGPSRESDQALRLGGHAGSLLLRSRNTAGERDTDFPVCERS